MRAVAVQIHQSKGGIGENPRGEWRRPEVRVGGVHSAVVEVNEDPGAVEVKVVVRGHRVGRNADRSATKVVGRYADSGHFDLLNAWQSGQLGQAIGLGQNPEHWTERR